MKISDHLLIYFISYVLIHAGGYQNHHSCAKCQGHYCRLSCVEYWYVFFNMHFDSRNVCLSSCSSHWFCIQLKATRGTSAGALILSLLDPAGSPPSSWRHLAAVCWVLDELPSVNCENEDAGAVRALAAQVAQSARGILSQVQLGLFCIYVWHLIHDCSFFQLLLFPRLDKSIKIVALTALGSLPASENSACSPDAAVPLLTRASAVEGTRAAAVQALARLSAKVSLASLLQVAAGTSDSHSPLGVLVAMLAQADRRTQLAAAYTLLVLLQRIGASSIALTEQEREPFVRVGVVVLAFVR